MGEGTLMKHILLALLLSISTSAWAGFANIAAGTDVQSVSFVNEFRRAQSERSQAIGGSSVANIAAGHDIQAAAFWRTMQDWVETNCANYVDHTHSVTGEIVMPMFTWTSFKTAAGLSSGGFRRNTGAGMTTGKIVRGDILGMWIFQDLQKAFDALRWTAETGDGVEIFVRSAFGSDTNEAAAKALTIADWATNSWTAASDSDYMYSATVIAITGGGAVLVTARSKGKIEVSSIPTHRPHSALFFARVGGSTDFANIDGIAGAVDGGFVLIETQTEDTIATRKTAEFSPSDNSPVEDLPWNPGDGDVQTGIAIKVVPPSDSLPVVIKWDFSDTL